MNAFTGWTQKDGIELCKILEPVAAKYRCHVALTGGLLYKGDERKDCDIIVYFEGRKPTDHADACAFKDCVDRKILIDAFWNECHVQPQDLYSRVVKCLYKGKQVDLIFPELDGEYIVAEHRLPSEEFKSLSELLK